MQEPLFSEAEIDYLKRLNLEPMFRGILEKVKNFPEIPSYKQGMTEKDWIYASGAAMAYESVHKILSGKEIKND